MSAVKKEITSMIERLPDDASYEDVQYHLYVVEKVKNGLSAAENGNAISQEQAEERLEKWIIS